MSLSVSLSVCVYVSLYLSHRPVVLEHEAGLLHAFPDLPRLLEPSFLRDDASAARLRPDKTCMNSFIIHLLVIH